MRIIKIGDSLELDLDRITHIGGMSGSMRDRKYSVYLDSGVSIEIREDEDDYHPVLKRKTLIKKWKSKGKSIPPSPPDPPAKRRTKSVH
jgi:hypothetical protein